MKHKYRLSLTTYEMTEKSEAKFRHTHESSEHDATMHFLLLRPGPVAFQWINYISKKCLFYCPHSRTHK